MFATDEASSRQPELVAAASAAGVPWKRATAGVLNHLTDTVTPQGVVAVCQMPEPQQAESVVTAESRLVVVLAQVRDPGNAGTVIRLADAAGADAVLLTAGSVDPFNPKCVRASAGSIFHLPVLPDAGDADAVIDGLRGHGLQVLAADGHGARGLDQLVDDELGRPTAWVLGNEAWGLPEALRDACDAAVAVPIYGRAESLNLAAAAVCIYATARAQHSWRGADHAASGH